MLQLEQYDDIISLGWNCEVSARITGYLGFLNSYVFSWIAINNRNKFLLSLNDSRIILRDGSKIWEGAGGSHVMLTCNNTGFGIHTKLPKERLSSPNELENAIQETKSRFNHLSDKFENIFTKNQRVLFILKPRIYTHPCEEDLKFCIDVYDVLVNKVKNEKFKLKFDLLIMVKDEDFNYFKSLLNDLKFDKDRRIIIKSVKYFSSVPNILNGGDIFGWLKVLSLFNLKNKIKNQVIFLDKNNKILPIEKFSNIHVKFKGNNSIVVIKDPERIKELNITLGSYSSVIIDEHVDIFYKLEIYAPNLNSRIEIGKNCFFSDVLISMDKLEQLSLTIGNNCRMYSNVIFKNTEIHSIYDMANNSIIDSFKNVSVGNHVLIYSDVTILFSSNIPNDSVVLSNSVVHGFLQESNTIYGGCYAEKIRSNINWKF